jgi:hypothetical protein
MTWPRRECKNWKEFDDIIEPLTNYAPSGYGTIFRGQACSDWPLQHSLSRKLGPSMDEEARIEIERAAMTQFQQQGHLHLGPGSPPKPDDLHGWWAFMQHHGAPTRLLDWTKSPFVALYFAVVEHPEQDGAVWLFSLSSLMEAMEAKHGYDPTVKRADYKAYYQATRLPHFLFPLDFYHQNQRMIAQQGLFTVCRNIMGDHGAIIDEVFKRDDGAYDAGYTQIVIPKAKKLEILRKLALFNITGSSLFPGIDGLGRSIGELVTMDSHYFGKSFSADT